MVFKDFCLAHRQCLDVWRALPSGSSSRIQQLPTGWLGCEDRYYPRRRRDPSHSGACRLGVTRVNVRRRYGVSVSVFGYHLLHRFLIDIYCRSACLFQAPMTSPIYTVWMPAAKPSYHSFGVLLRKSFSFWCHAVMVSHSMTVFASL